MTVVGSRMERLLWWYGEDGYEDGEAGWWRRLCAASNDVLEVGANIGYYSVVGAAASLGTYTAVEPNPEAAAIVRANLDLNGLGDAEVVEAAVVGEGVADEVELAFPDQEAHSTAPMGSFLRVGTETIDDRAARRSIMVRTVDAASLFRGRDLVKLDIEGSEATVLEAAAAEIRRSRPILLVEVLQGSTRLRAVIADLVANGYRLHVLTGDALTPVTVESLADLNNRDVLLTPPEREVIG